MIFLMTIAGCKQLNNDHLPPAKMEAVLYDISIAETYSAESPDNNHFAGQKNTDTLTELYREIFARHQVAREQFDQSLSWYKKHPDDLDSIYTHLSVKVDKHLADEMKKKKK